MDSLQARVNTIQSDLQNSNGRLQTLEQGAKKSLSNEVDGIWTALQSSDKQIQEVSLEVQALVRAIEDCDPSSVNLNPQITWLGTNLSSIVTNLKKAESHADSAMSHAMNYRYQVKDVSKSVYRNKCELDKAESDGQTLAEEAQSQLDRSIKLMEAARDEIQSKEVMLANQTDYFDRLKAWKEERESELRQARNALSEAEEWARKEKRKGTALGIVRHLSSEGLLRS
jgi:chromosome segregation ATPase